MLVLAETSQNTNLHTAAQWYIHIDDFVQEYGNSSALAMELSWC